jgi:arylsulfatase A-like enzyme
MARHLSLEKGLALACLMGAVIGALAAWFELALMVTLGRGAPLNSLALPMCCIYTALGAAACALVTLAGAVIARLATGAYRAAGVVAAAAALLTSVFAFLYIVIALLKLYSLVVPGGPVGAALLGALAMAVGTLVLRKLFRGILSCCRSHGRLAIVNLTAGAVSYSSSEAKPESSSGRRSLDHPDVFLILVDAMRPDHMSAYGYHRETTPEIARLAKEGAVFLDAHAQSAWTKATTATLFTSLYPSTHRTEGLDDVLPADALTMPEAFKDHGYSTGIFSASVLVSPQFGFAGGVDVFRFPLYSLMTRFSSVGLAAAKLAAAVRGAAPLKSQIEKVELMIRGRGLSQGGFSAEQINEDVIEWVESNPDAPLFAYLHYMEPHDPYRPPASFSKMFLTGEAEGGASGKPPRVTGLLLPFDEAESVPETERRHLIDLYDAEIAYIDSLIGRLVQKLRALRGDNIVVVITADHGEEFFEHGGWSHGVSLFEEILRIPLVCWWPAGIQDGLSIPGLACQIDIFPTLLEVCGIPRDPSLMGFSLAPMLLGAEHRVPYRMALSELRRARGRSARALQDDQFKLILAKRPDRERLMLFDLVSDPGETRDISETMPGKTQQMLEALETIVSAIQEQALQGSRATLDNETLEALKSLGYVD